jgi:hypothetical protein
VDAGHGHAGAVPTLRQFVNGQISDHQNIDLLITNHQTIDNQISNH